jgi:hypothetical protein
MLRKPNKWLLHIKNFKLDHPNMKYSEVLKNAKLTYNKDNKRGGNLNSNKLTREYTTKIGGSKKGKGVWDSLQNFGAKITESKNGAPKNRLYAGEKHGLIYDGYQYQPAEYLGGNTNVIERTKLHQMGLTPVDRVAKRHDLDYALGRSLNDIEIADDRFYEHLDRIQKNKSDYPFNINQAKLLKLKNYLPIGSTYGDKKATPQDFQRFREQRNELEKMGYGRNYV